MAGFRIDNYNTWNELLFRASFERSPNDLLYIKKFGRSANLTADTTEDVWETGGTKAILTAAETMDVVSTSAQDTNTTGTGAWLVQVSGVDSNYNLVTETVTMAGLTPVTTTQEFLAVNRVRSVLNGTNQVNVGTISVTGSSSASAQATVSIGEGITQQSFFTVPAGYTLFTIDFAASTYRASGTGNKEAEIDQMVYVPEANAKYETLRYGVSTGGPFISSPKLVSQTPEKSTLWYQATAASNNTLVSTIASYVLVRGDFNYRTEL